jgi:hypothetical protein
MAEAARPWCASAPFRRSVETRNHRPQRQRAHAGGRPGRWDTPCENPRLRQNAITMDIERVNAIGSLLADLSARTEQLRGYL